MNRKNTLLISLAAAVVFIGAAAAAAYAYISSSYDYEPVRVEIPAGTKSDSIPTIIRGALGNSFGSKVANIWKASGSNADVARGSYLVEPGDRALDVAKRIAKGRQTPVKLTFNNIRLFSDLAGHIGSQMEFDSIAFMNAVDSILVPQGFRPETYAAAFLPDTYEFYWTATPEKVISVLSDHRNKFWNDSRRAKARALGLNPEEVHTVASIVEEESNKTDERPVIARLYLNRLAKHMPLQADPTVKFAVGDFALRRIGHKQIDFDSPYNTYIYQGLPPGPIRIVDARSIDAVLNAPENDYLYMCAKSDFSGYHDFTDNYGRHRINAARYHRALTARGIK